MSVVVNHPGSGWQEIYRKEPLLAAITSDSIPVIGQDWLELQFSAMIFNGHASATGNYDLNPNGLTTNAVNTYFGVFGGSVLDVQATNMRIAYEIDAQDNNAITWTFFPRTGVKRIGHGQVTGRSDAAVEYTACMSATWTDTSTALTSLTLLSSQTGGLGVGSHWTLKGIPI